MGNFGKIMLTVVGLSLGYNLLTNKNLGVPIGNLFPGLPDPKRFPNSEYAYMMSTKKNPVPVGGQALGMHPGQFGVSWDDDPKAFYWFDAATGALKSKDFADKYV